MKLGFEWGVLPAYSVLTDEDIYTILQQMKGRKFSLNLLYGIASRCLFGKPKVILCKSLHNGKPFPNNFWLSCPVLVKMAGQLESIGGVKELESYISNNFKTDWEIYSRLHTKIRIGLASKNELEILKQTNSPLYKTLCDDNIGIGGIRISKEVQIKCLHLQLASFLSLGFHPGQDWLKEKIPISYIINY